MPSWLVTILTMFAGPIGNLVSTGIATGAASFTTWMVNSGVPTTNASVIAGGIATAVAGAVSILTGTQSVAIRSVNTTANGVRAVSTDAAKKAGIPPADGPLK